MGGLRCTHWPRVWAGHARRFCAPDRLAEGMEVDMGTPFNRFGAQSRIDHPALAPDVQDKRCWLRALLRRHGFRRLPAAWCGTTRWATSRTRTAISTSPCADLPMGQGRLLNSTSHRGRPCLALLPLSGHWPPQRRSPDTGQGGAWRLPYFWAATMLPLFSAGSPGFPDPCTSAPILWQTACLSRPWPA